jgi:hypothetical protein
MDTPNFKKGYKPNENANDSIKEIITQSLLTVLPQVMKDVIQSRSDLNSRTRTENNQVELLLLKMCRLEDQLSSLADDVSRISDKVFMPDPIYTLDEALEIMQISVDTFRRRVKAGKISCKKDGAVIYVRQSDIEAYWAGLEYVK